MTKLRIWMWQKIAGATCMLALWVEQKLLCAQIDQELTQAERETRLEALLKTLEK